MAFDANQFINQKKSGKSDSFDVNKFIKEKTAKKTSGFDVNQFIANKVNGKPMASGKLGESNDLYSLAVQSGYQNDADRIIGQKGEETKKIFSGGFISDTFDVLNALSYGVVGTLKGKGFIEGIKTRQSFTDQDSLGSKGIPGLIAGIALDIAVDPLTYIAPATILKKIPGLSKGLNLAKKAVFGEMATKAIQGTNKTFQTIEGGTETGKYLARKLKWMFGADPVFKETWQRSETARIKSIQNVMDMNKGIVNLSKEKSKQLLVKGADGRYQLNSLENLAKILNPEEFKGVQEAITNLDKLGAEAVQLGRLSKETWEKNRWQYLKSLYSTYEVPEKGKGFFGALKNKVSPIKARVKDLTPEQMKELGQIDNPAYLLAKSQIDLLVGNENTKLFNELADKFASDTWVEGMAKKALPDSVGYGAAKGKYVPEFISDYLTDIQRAKTPAERLANQVVGGFKYGKVILNPATHARNVMSNMVLNWWKLGIGPWRADIYAKALKPSSKIMNELKTVGYNLDTFAANELPELLTGGGNKAVGKLKGVAKKLADLYQGEENFAKRAAYIFGREKGLGIEEAWKAAESATFNYAQVTPLVRRLRESIFGFPFITFTVKATPTAVETMLKNPKRVSVFGKIKETLEPEDEETKRERASEPQWIKDGFYIKLPMKDKFGRSAYFDLTYIIPFGDLASGNFVERSVSRETGLPEGVPSALAGKSPVFQLIKELTSNQDFYGDKIFQDGDTTDKQLGDVFRHVVKTYSPPVVADQLPGGHIQAGKLRGTRRQKGVLKSLGVNTDNAEQQRTVMEELLRNVGAKVQPIDADLQETYMESEKKKALTTLLREKGVVADFTIPYVPKE